MEKSRGIDNSMLIKYCERLGFNIYNDRYAVRTDRNKSVLIFLNDSFDLQIMGLSNTRTTIPTTTWNEIVGTVGAVDVVYIPITNYRRNAKFKEYLWNKDLKYSVAWDDAPISSLNGHKSHVAFLRIEPKRSTTAEFYDHMLTSDPTADKKYKTAKNGEFSRFAKGIQKRLKKYFPSTIFSGYQYQKFDTAFCKTKSFGGSLLWALEKEVEGCPEMIPRVKESDWEKLYKMC